MSKKLNLADAVRAREAFLAGVERVPAVAEGKGSAPAEARADIQPDVHTYIKLAAPEPKPVRKHYTFSLDIELHQRLRITAAVQGREMRDLIEESLRSYFREGDAERA